MVPAAKREVGATRRFMSNAREAVEQTPGRRSGLTNSTCSRPTTSPRSKSTCLSPVTPTAPRSPEQAQLRLTGVDAERRGSGRRARALGRIEQAAVCYEQTVDAGPPYLGHHLLRAAECRSRTGDPEPTLTHYRRLADLASENLPVLQAGPDLARTAGH